MRFAESKKELDAFLFEESPATVPFLISGNKIDMPQVGTLSRPVYVQEVGMLSRPVYVKEVGMLNRPWPMVL